LTRSGGTAYAPVVEREEVVMKVQFRISLRLDVVLS
jgi:hypothetical protein